MIDAAKKNKQHIQLPTTTPKLHKNVRLLINICHSGCPGTRGGGHVEILSRSHMQKKSNYIPTAVIAEFGSLLLRLIKVLGLLTKYYVQEQSKVPKAQKVHIYGFYNHMHLLIFLYHHFAHTTRDIHFPLQEILVCCTLA